MKCDFLSRGYSRFFSGTNWVQLPTGQSREPTGEYPRPHTRDDQPEDLNCFLEAFFGAELEQLQNDQLTSL